MFSKHGEGGKPCLSGGRHPGLVMVRVAGVVSFFLLVATSVVLSRSGGRNAGHPCRSFTLTVCHCIGCSSPTKRQRHTDVLTVTALVAGERGTCVQK